MRTALLISALVLAAVAGDRPLAADSKPARPLAVVVGRESKLTGLSRADLRRCFTGEPVTAGGRHLIPFNFLPSTAERTAFDRAVLGMAPDEVGRFWIDRKIRGHAGAPRTLPSAAHVAKVIAKFPGAIGYLPLELVTADHKVIAIDDVRPTAAGYPIMFK